MENLKILTKIELNFDFGTIIIEVEFDFGQKRLKPEPGAAGLE